jgi:hypothetical protein
VLKAAGFTKAQISNVRALAHDLRLSQPTMQATALPAGPNTAATPWGRRGGGRQRRGQAVDPVEAPRGSWAGLHVGDPDGAITGSVGAIGEHLTRAMRGAGLAKARDIVQAGLPDPEIGRQLLLRASEIPDGASERALARAIARRSVFAALGASASAGSSSSQELPASRYGLNRLDSALSPADAQSLRRSPDLARRSGSRSDRRSTSSLRRWPS